MKATIYFPSGETRVLDEQQLFDLRVLRQQLMGLPVLCADDHQAARVLGLAQVEILAQGGAYVAFAGQETEAGSTYQVLESNPVAGAHLRTLGVRSSKPCPVGPVLVIEAEATGRPQSVPSQNYCLAL